MKTDLYTKTVLTIIAACLVVLVMKEVKLIPEAVAATPTLPVAGRNYGLVPVNADGSVTVRFQTREAMPVNIVGIHKPFSSTDVNRYSWDAISTSR
ncbi:hypothetical protein KB206_03760 [Microvirga sp. STS02]|uniref:hypothetical protein n=1 Tax=Hymenobacter negativus TaxID=2795026 RepID=UPI0018DCD23E|nr:MULTISPECIES: hypothetical protein [Bacteria]MBH8567983.1 hypothetical protein [Hymenobacter negativus]MBR7207719.1 hypothetical protein [Microvirga sp. STS02]